MVAELQILALGVAGFVPLAFAGGFGPSLAAVYAAQFILDDQPPGLAAASLLVLTVIIPPPVYLWARHIEARRYRRQAHGWRNLWGR